MSSLLDLVDSALSPLDALRRTIFVAGARVPWLGRLLARRDSRVGLSAAFGVLVLFVATVLAPGALYVLGPALLGVAHVASDARYLVVRRAPSRALLLVLCASMAALVGSRFAELVSPHALPFARLEVTLGFGLPLVTAVLGAIAVRSPRRLLVILPLLSWAFYEATLQPAVARFLFGHAHNVIALALWVVLFRRRAVAAAPAIVLLALGTGLFFSGATTFWSPLTSNWDRRFVEEMTMAPAFVPARWLLGLGLSFVFLQAAHYSAWLAWIPQEDLRGEGTTSFRMSAKSLLRDFRPWGLALITALALLVILASFASVHRTRHIYLSVATFHGYLELALFAYFLARGGLPAEAPVP